jgi:hypothetical protein
VSDRCRELPAIAACPSDVRSASSLWWRSRGEGLISAITFANFFFGAGNADPAGVFCVPPEDHIMNGVIYLIGLVVVVLAILSFLGLN